jgi:hypothetical protein
MSDKIREALQDLVIRYKTLFQLYAAKAYRPGCDWASDLDLGLAQAREALAQADQPTAPAGDKMRDVLQRMTELCEAAGLWPKTAAEARAVLAEQRGEVVTWADVGMSLSPVSRGLWDGDETVTFKADALLKYINRVRAWAPPATEVPRG